MRRLSMASVVERRLLVNYRVDPEIAARLLPMPLRPQQVVGNMDPGPVNAGYDAGPQARRKHRTFRISALPQYPRRCRGMKCLVKRDLLSSTPGFGRYDLPLLM